jgi:hypothetical protein
MVKNKQTEGSSKYYKGTISMLDTKWKVETIEDDKIIILGEITVLGKLVAKEMDEHKSIKGYEPHSIAIGEVYKKFARRLKVKGKHLMKPVIVSLISESSPKKEC